MTIRISGETHEDQRSGLACRHCGTNLNSAVSIVCESCSRVLLDLGWIPYLALMLLLTTLGLWIGQTGDTVAPAVFISVLLVLYSRALLRHYDQVRSRPLIHAALVAPLPFLFERDPKSVWGGLALPLMLILIVLALALVLFTSWRRICRESDVPTLQGLSVLSFLLFFGALTLKGLLEGGVIDLFFSAGLLSDAAPIVIKLRKVLESSVHLREVLLAATGVVLLFLSTVAAGQRRIDRPQDLVDLDSLFPSSRRNSSWKLQGGPWGVASQFANSVLALLRPALRILIQALNGLKVYLELAFRYLVAWAVELWILIRTSSIVLFRVLLRVLRIDVCPMIILLVVVWSASSISADVLRYFEAGRLSSVSALGVLGCYLGIMAYVLFLAGDRVSSNTRGVAISNTWLSFVVWGSLLMAGWTLWVLGQIAPLPGFSKVGDFTLYATLVLAIVLAVIAALSLKRKLGGQPPQNRTGAVL